MSRYYFHVRGKDQVDLDTEGIDLPDSAAARREAIAAARDMVVEAVVGDTAIDHRRIEVVSASGELVATIPLQSVINI
jgi:hypothetical protein